MRGYPIAWEDRFSDQAIPSDDCPYSVEEIEGYLRNCHYHLSLQEPPLSFRVNGPILSRQLVDRNFWIFGATNDLKQEWFVLVGSGKSPFKSHGKTWRWMYAEENELGQTPDEYFEDALAQQLSADAHPDR
jgi:hypothetical protein